MNSEPVTVGRVSSEVGTTILNDCTPLEAALWLAQRGIHVLPLWPLTGDGTCTCWRGAKCEKPGKHPLSALVQRGYHDATTEAAIIREWWERCPDANVGISLRPSRLVAVDFDSTETLAALGPSLPPTLTVESRPGRRHYYYCLPEDCPAERALHPRRYDLLADGLTVAPPSRHYSGSRYAVVEDMAWATVDDLPEPPTWVIAELEDRALEREAKASVAFDPDAELDGAEVYGRVQHRLSQRIRSLIEEGHGALLETEKDRSSADSMVCTALAALGCTDDDIRAIYQTYPIGTEGKYAQRGDKYLKTTIAKVRAYLAANSKEGTNRMEVVEATMPTVLAVAGHGGTLAAAPDQIVQRLEAATLTDQVLAETLVAVHGHGIRYVPELKRWFAWDGRRWVEDAAATRVEALAVVTARLVQMWAVTKLHDADKRKKLLGQALQAEGNQRVKAAVERARAVPEVAIPVGAFDAQPFLLNVQNGTLDLRTGALREHRQADLLTQGASVPYDPTATAPQWEAFLRTIFCNDEALIGYVQRVVGYCLAGDVSERAFFVLYGGGRNGKSVFVEVLRAVLGDYAAALDPQALLSHKDRPHPADLAVLRGKRLAYAQEAPEGRRLNEPLVKALTGGDTITVRVMHGNPFEMKPTFKLWLSTNSKPIIREMGTAMWDRIKLIPFRYTVPKGQEEKRHALVERFAVEEGAGVLRWAVAGYAAYLGHDLDEPATVREAVEDYREEMDALGRFVEESCAPGPGYWTSTGDLYGAYQVWCRKNGEDAWTARGFGKALGERGFKSDKERGERGWRGLRLKEEWRGTELPSMRMAR